MSLRVRMAFVAAGAVAIAVIAVAISAYEGTRSELRDQLDDSLAAISQPLLQRAGVLTAPTGGGRISATELGQGPPVPSASAGPGPPGSLQDIAVGDCDSGLGIDTQQGGGFGSAEGYKELVRRDGQVCLARGESVDLPVDERIHQLALTGYGQFFTETDAGGVHLRILASGVSWRGALLVALPMTDVDSALSQELLLLVLIAAGGIGLAIALGLLVARFALSPIARFTRQTEAIARQPDRLEHERLEVTGGDELARLARTFNATLDALERSVEAQRNLVADASHELRTPIASIRANIQLMRDEALLSLADRAALRSDIIEELDELTALVSDVVELARGSKQEGESDELRLDEVVSDALRRARRRAPELAFEAQLEPTLIHGSGEQIARAVTNLLDNAAKWSPPGEVVEVRLRRGLLVVRDHGPGFAEEDLAYVFDRFHRATQARSKPGSGLGLAIVRQAAEAHGGFAEAGNAPDGGALLRVSFGDPIPMGDIAPERPVRA